MDLITLADLPALQGTDPKPRATIAIGRLDDNLRDPRYGRFKITQAQVDGWKRNLSDTFGGQVSIDFDHSSDRGGGTKAAAWITSIDQTGRSNGSLITADVQFSRAGAKSVRNGEYKYTSPTFVENYTDEHGEKHGPALIGAALTNRPVLRKGMPTLSLSRDTFDDVATVENKASKSERRRARKAARLVLSTPERPRDSRPRMDLSELAKLLDLPADADTVSILAKVATLKPPSNDSDGDANQADSAKAAKKARKLARKQQESDTRTLADGTTVVTMSAERLAELETRANAGASAATQLSEDRFRSAYEKALSEGRVAPSQEENLRELHKLDPELAIKTLDSFVRIVPTRPAGSGEAGASAGPAPTGVDPDRFQLHTEAQQLADARIAANPALDRLETYSLAAAEIEDRKFMAENGGF